MTNALAAKATAATTAEASPSLRDLIATPSLCTSTFYRGAKADLRQGNVLEPGRLHDAELHSQRGEERPQVGVVAKEDLDLAPGDNLGGRREVDRVGDDEGQFVVL